MWASCPRPAASFTRVSGWRRVAMWLFLCTRLAATPAGSGACVECGANASAQGSEIVAEFAEESGFTARAHDTGDRLATLEQDQSRDGHHLVLLNGQGVGVNVELGHGEALDVLGGDFFEHRCHGTAGAAPLRPEVHQYGCGAFEDVGHK